MSEHKVSGTCAGDRAGMGPCSRPCGDRLMGCTVTCCAGHRALYTIPQEGRDE